MDVIESLALGVASVVDNPDAIISIRNEDGEYIFVNEAWEKAAKVTRADVLGKRLSALDVIPFHEAVRFEQEDCFVREQKNFVTNRSYTVRGEPLRVLVIRVFLRFKGQDYLVEVSIPFKPMVIENDLFQMWLGLEAAYGQLVATRLLFLNSSEVDVP